MGEIITLNVFLGLIRAAMRVCVRELITQKQFLTICYELVLDDFIPPRCNHQRVTYIIATYQTKNNMYSCIRVIFLGLLTYYTTAIEARQRGIGPSFDRPRFFLNIFQ